MSSQEALSQKQAGKRRRRSAPPPRLGWPGGTTQSYSQPQTQPAAGISHSQPVSATRGSSKTKPSSASKRKRALFNNNNLEGNNDNDDNSNLMWTEKYAPTCRKDLCVAPKKIQEVAQWLENDSQERLLILVGRPGIGKSSMMKVLAEEANAELLEWSETYSTWSQHVESQSPLNSFAQFLQQSGAGFSSLDLQLTTTATTTKASTVNGLLLPQKRLIVLEELPHLASAESQEQFRELFTNHVQSSNVKTVWIYSDVTEGNHKPQDLERHIDSSVLYAHSKILQINPATKAQLKKSLERIAKAERFPISKDFCERMHLQSGGDVRYAIMALQFDQAGGQRYQNAKKSFFASKIKGNKNSAQSPPPLQQAPRDTQWTAFHALGKILYAKREEVDDDDDDDDDDTPSNPNERPPLKFDPEGVLEHCDLDLGNALTYLGFHSVDFFTDIQEISTAFDLYSDASYLLEQTTNYNYQRRYGSYSNSNASTTVSCPIFPEGYVTSLASRSVAYANHHPAPSRFRHLEAPKIFEINRKRTDNEHQLHRLQQRLSMVSMADVTRGTSSSNLTPFVMDRLPFLNVIAPQAVTKSLDRLHTSNSEHAVRFLEVQREEEAAAMERLQKEQEAVLQLDDIEDFNSSDEDEENEPGATATAAVARNMQNNPHQQPSIVATKPAVPTLSQASQPSQPSHPVKKPTKLVFNPYKKKTVNSKTDPTALKAPPQVSWGRPSKENVKKFVNPYANPKK